MTHRTKGLLAPGLALPSTAASYNKLTGAKTQQCHPSVPKVSVLCAPFSSISGSFLLSAGVLLPKPNCHHTLVGQLLGSTKQLLPEADVGWAAESKQIQQCLRQYKHPSASLVTCPGSRCSSTPIAHRRLSKQHQPLVDEIRWTDSVKRQGAPSLRLTPLPRRPCLV